MTTGVESMDFASLFELVNLVSITSEQHHISQIAFSKTNYLGVCDTTELPWHIWFCPEPVHEWWLLLYQSKMKATSEPSKCFTEINFTRTGL